MLRKFAPVGVLFAALTAAIPAVGQVTPLPSVPLDVRYSASLDRLVTISKTPAQLQIVNPSTGLASVVDLPKEPTSISVSPDGKYAAVGHDALVSYVNLSTASVEKYLPVSIKVTDVLLTGNGFVQAFPSVAVNRATGVETSFSTWYVPSKPMLHPNGKSVYYTRDGTSPNDVQKGEVTTGAFKFLYDSRYHGDYSICGGVFYTADGQRLINGCGTLFRLSDIQADDITYNGSLSAASSLRSAVHLPSSKRIAVLPGISSWNPATTTTDTEIQFYEDQYLVLQGRTSLPVIAPGAPWRGSYMFADGAGTKLYIVVHPDSKAPASTPWGVYTLTTPADATCDSVLGSSAANVGSGGGDTTVNVTATAGCVWQASTSSSWLFVGSGGVASGSGSVTLTAAPNLQTAPRTATVSIAGRTFTLTQSGASSASTDPLTSMPFRPVAAEYSTPLDKLVIVSASPNALHIYDPSSRSAQSVALTLPPTAISISPDGTTATVGHSGWISVVNLQTATVTKIVPVSTDVFRLAMTATTAYAFPLHDQWEQIHAVNLTTGLETVFGSTYTGSTGGRVSPDGKYLYVTDGVTYSLPANTSAGAVAISGCNDLWFGADATWMFSRCGEVGRVSGPNVTYAGQLFSTYTLGVSQSPASKLVAAIQQSSGTAAEDTKVQLFSGEYMTPVGSISLPKQQYGNSQVVMHGRYVFWNKAGTQMHVVVQADAASGVLYDYSIYTLSTTASCGIAFPGATSAIPAEGGAGTLPVSGADGCVWFATSDAPWLTITAGAAGAGSGSVSWFAEPNLTAAARTASVTAGGQKFTLTQAAGSSALAGPTFVLPFHMIDAEYSYGLDRLVTVSDSPLFLNVYDPATRANARVALAKTPTALALSADGLRAAVGHDGLITIVNLQTLAVEKTLTATIKVFDLAIANNNWVYATQTGGWGTGVSINIASGAETKIDMLYNGLNLRTDPSGTALYATDVTTSGRYTSRFRISAGPMQLDYQVWETACGNFWFTQDNRMISSCGTLLKLGGTQAEDLKYSGTLSGVTSGLAWSTHSSARGIIASIPSSGYGSNSLDRQVVLHDDQFLASRGTIPLPKFPVPASNIDSRGRYIFWDKNASRLYVVMQAASGGLTNDFALHTISPQVSAGCAVTLTSTTANAPASGVTSASVAVTAASDCVWSATSNASWITVTSGGFAAGIGNVGYKVDANPNQTQRTGTISVGGATLTITQAAGDGSACTANLNGSSLAVPVNGASGAFLLTIASGCSWTASSSTAWAQVFPLTGTGGANISVTIYPNNTSATRAAVLTVAGKTLTITQAPSLAPANDRFVSQMYFNALGRIPSPAEVAFHSGNLSTLSRAETAMNFINSEEFNLRGRFIAGLYVGILGRDAEFGGWLFQRNALVTGQTSQDRLVPAFLNSAEFNLRYGVLTDTGFVQLLYRNVLGREASGDEVTFQSGALKTNIMTRLTMAQQFLNSQEFRIRTDKRMTASLLYSVLLMRSITDAEMAARVAELSGGTSVTAIAAEIIASPEFAALLN